MASTVLRQVVVFSYAVGHTLTVHFENRGALGLEAGAFVHGFGHVVFEAIVPDFLVGS